MDFYKKWFLEKCEHLRGYIVNEEVCYVPNSAYSYDYFISAPPNYIVDMDRSIERYRVWWWVGFIVTAIMIPLIFYPIYGWNVINFDFGIVLVFMVLVYGHRISRTWRVLCIIVIIYQFWYLGLLFYTLWSTGTWYPDDFDFWGHLIMGFLLFFAFSSVMPRKHPIIILAISILAGIVYECLEWFCSTFYTMPLLWWTFENALYDTCNNILGGIIAVILEYVIRRAKYRELIQKK